MRILYLITRSDVVGGASTHLLQISELVQSECNEVMVALGGHGEINHLFSSKGIKTAVFPSLVRDFSIVNDVRFCISLMRLVSLWRPSIVHLHSFKASLLGRLVLVFFPFAKVVYTAHGWNFSRSVPSRSTRIISSIIEVFLAYLCDRIICVCHSDLALASSIRFFPTAKLNLIYNSCLSSFSYDPQSRELDLDLRSPIRLIMVSRFEYQKDHNTLFTALASILYLPWQLTLVGSGPLKSQMEETATFLGLNSRINFVGHRTDVSSFYHNSDIFILSSRWEGFPISILEAMSCSLPIIAADVGGVSEAVVDSFNGYLFNPGDYCRLAECILRLAQNRSLLMQYGKNSRHRLVANFSPDKLKQSLMSLYLSI